MSAISTIDIDGEVQLMDNLCWAAVSVMAVRAFGSKARQVSQPEVVYFQQLGIETKAQLTAMKTDLAQLKIDFNFPDVSGLAALGDPWLFGLKSSDVPPNKILAEAHFIKDIVERKRPVIISWDYSQDDRTTSDIPHGQHVLIVTGYNDSDPQHRLRVWDPWPTVERAATMATPVDREKWISYDTYVNPQNDHGLKASHASDEFKLRLKGEAAPRYPALLDEPPPAPGPPPAPVEIDFQQGIADGLPAISEQMRKHVVLTRKGSRMPGPFTAAAAIPIVALSMRALLLARERPHSLLVDRTAALLVPVMYGRRLVDSYMLLNGSSAWRVGGYTNNRIAQLLVTLRDKYSDRMRLPRDFYLVSVPEQGSFFLAHGFENRSQLLSLNNNGRGAFVPGEQALGRLISRIVGKEPPSDPKRPHGARKRQGR